MCVRDVEEEKMLKVVKFRRMGLLIAFRGNRIFVKVVLKIVLQSN